MIGKHPYFKQQKQTIMPDISMCKGGYCLLKTMCHRCTATAEPLGQSFFSEPPYKLTIASEAQGAGTVVLTCEYFWSNKEYKDEAPKNN